MKKTVTINISGIIFHIDEDAFEKIFEYIDDIKGYLTLTEGKDEIIADVEARIAEMLQQKINEAKQVITIEDIDGIISILGDPSQFGTETESNNNKRRVMHSTAKRFYRDPDNKIIGGVCSGIANYFNIDPLWVRIIFAIALFVFGSGVLLYLFLWIITPEARTTTERLEMRGEAVNIHNIEKSVKEELRQIQKRFKGFKKKDHLDDLKDRKNISTESFIERIIYFLLALLKICIRLFVVIFGIVLIFIGVFLLIGFMGSIIKGGEVISFSNIGVTNLSFASFINLVIDSPAQITMITIGLLLLIGIPLIMIIYNGIKMIFGFRTKFKVIGISAFSLWLTGLILCIFVSVKVISDFSTKMVVPTKYTITSFQKKNIYIDIKTNDSIEDYMEYNNSYFLNNWYLMKLDAQKTGIGIPQINIITSETDSIKLIVFSEARGRNTKEAIINAKNITYNFTQTDSSLILDPFFIVHNYNKWRMQRVRVLLKVPEGEKVVINKRLYYYFNKHNNIDYDMLGKKLIMQNGDLIEEQKRNSTDSLKTK
jgi:phage shock protein PspC (stress-responsive transcriptional regulator)